MMRFILGFIACAGLLLIGGVIVVYSGWYNVAATEPHLAVTKWVFHQTMHNSVKRQAKGIAAPELTDTLAAEGLPHFQEMCVSCHGAPGVQRGDIGKGLTPTPPDLAEASEHRSTAELFWVVKNGIRMTGMPAWGPTHSDEEIWAMVALLKRLPGLSPEAYAAMIATEMPRPAGGHEHEHGTGHKH